METLRSVKEFTVQTSTGALESRWQHMLLEAAELFGSVSITPAPVEGDGVAISWNVDHETDTSVPVRWLLKKR